MLQIMVVVWLAVTGVVCLLLAYVLNANELMLTTIGIACLVVAAVRLLSQPKMSSNMSHASRNQLRSDLRTLMQDFYSPASASDASASKVPLVNSLRSGVQYARP